MNPAHLSIAARWLPVLGVVAMGLVAPAANPAPDRDRSIQTAALSVAVPSPVRLEARTGAGTVEILWPAAAEDLRLQASASVSGPWQDVTGSPRLDGKTRVWTVPSTSTAMFFRGRPAGKFADYAGLGLELIDGEYLLIFEDSRVPAAAVEGLARSLVTGTAGEIQHVFTETFRGFAVRSLTDDWAVAMSLRDDVRWVRKNFRIYGSELRGGPFAPVPWNLDRVDQRESLGVDRDYCLKTGPRPTGTPVPIFVLDSGIYKEHHEFDQASGTGSRVEDVADFTGTTPQFALQDDHGTAAASIAAGRTLGITPAILKNVRVMRLSSIFGTGISGSPTTVSAGLERSCTYMKAQGIQRAIVNLSLGWSRAAGMSPTMDVARAVECLQQNGAIVVAAAGNENVDAAGVEPANLPGVVAVGAMTAQDERLVVSPSNGSNFGATVAIWAPGYSVKTATWQASPDPNATTSSSGTSLAAPHVSGALALLWEQHPQWSSQQVIDALLQRATLDALNPATLGSGSINRLLYVGEDPPTGVPHLTPRSPADTTGLWSARLANDGTRLYVGSGDVSSGTPVTPVGPYTYAAYDPSNLDQPLWSQNPVTDPAVLGCVGSYDLNDRVYFGCQAVARNGVRGSLVVAWDKNGRYAWQAWLGPDTYLNAITGVFVGNTGFRLFVIGTRAKSSPAGDTEVFVMAIDTDTGSRVREAVLAPTGFNDPHHRGVGVAVVDYDTSFGASDLVAATYSDSPGDDRTYLWKLNPETLTLLDWREVRPTGALGKPLVGGMIATALKAENLVDNGSGIRVPGEVYLATQVFQVTHSGTLPVARIYRLNQDRVSVHSLIDEVSNAVITGLSTGEGDVYFAGTGIVPPLGSDAFLGKNVGVAGGRRWLVGFDTSPQTHQPANDGYGSYGNGKAYLVGTDPAESYLVEYRIY